MRTMRRALAGAVAGVLAAGLTLAACDRAQHSAGRGSPSARPAPHAATTPAGGPPADLTARLLRTSDLPTGFVIRPLGSRNLPSGLTGCPPVQKLIATGIGHHAQVEYFRLPFGPWVDEAAIEPARGTADELTARLATGISGCRSVTVTEEGYRVKLALSTVPPPPLSTAVAAATRGDVHAYRGAGGFHGVSLGMDIMLVRAGDLVALITNTAIGGVAGPGLNGALLQAAVTRAAS